MTRLRALEVIGFRAFGSARQTLVFEKDLAFIYGPNSQGKTSLAEAIEFLLTGTTSRRELIGSAVREFADALRNAHLADGIQVSVRATLETADGAAHVAERRLLSDCTASGDCASELTIDGAPANNFSALGIILAQPPLSAPILMPHGLRYVFEAEPSQRTAYFKMLLEMSDLDEVRREIAGLNAGLNAAMSATASEKLAQFTSCARNAVFGDRLAQAEGTADSAREALGEAIALAAGSPSDMPRALDERVAFLRSLLAEKQRAVFPLDGLRPGGAVDWVPPPASLFDDVLKYCGLLATINAELARVQALYVTLLEIPAYRDLKAPERRMDCPVCKTGDGLTGARIEEIRTALKSSAAVTAARTKATVAFREITGQAAKALLTVSRCKAPVFGWGVEERKRRGYSIELLRELAGDGGAELVDRWRTAANELRESASQAEAMLKKHEASLTSLRLDSFDNKSAATGRAELEAVGAVVSSVAVAYAAYSRAHESIVERVQPVLANRTSTEGWAQLLTLAGDVNALSAALREGHAQRATQSDLDLALKQIDAAIAEVLDGKYEQLGDDVSRWWKLMRPDATTRFSGLQRAGSGRRFIDMKAGLFEAEARQEPTAVRDAVAVFSDSQLNCLALAAFLARTVRQKNGLVVLDDPFPSSDTDHRTMFIDAVLPELAKEEIQVILLTHDDVAIRDAQTLHEHTGIDTFEITLADPLAGATVTRTKDDLDVLLAKANALLRTNAAAAEPRKVAARHLRDAAERFCKVLLVKDRRAQGGNAVPSDFDKTLGELIPMVEPLLTQNGGDPGKLRVIPVRLNPGNHDDSPPSLTDLKVSHGNLSDFKKRYLV